MKYAIQPILKEIDEFVESLDPSYSDHLTVWCEDDLVIEAFVLLMKLHKTNKGE